MELEDSLPLSQPPATRPYSESDKSNTRLTIQVLEDPF
jgi:hypothetical protein